MTPEMTQVIEEYRDAVRDAWTDTARRSHYRAETEAEAALLAAVNSIQARAERAEAALEFAHYQRDRIVSRCSALEAGLKEFIAAFRNRGETTSLHTWNERMKAACQTADTLVGPSGQEAALAAVPS